MEFNPTAIKNRDLYLDEILKQPDLIKSALKNMHLSGTFHSVPRVWSPGGGSSLFKIITDTDQTYFMKIKHSSVTVESKLEAEKEFISLPALKNEYNFLRKYQENPHIPKLIGYTELSGYNFLVTETLTTFDATIPKLSPEDIIKTYQQIEDFIKFIYSNGDIHTDLHEKNIMFREITPVIIDWEEARHLPQTTNFKDSLDISGGNELGNIGQTPKFPGMMPGYTSLNRLRRVFQLRLCDKLPELLSTAAYNNISGICTVLEHGNDPRSYQSINLPGYTLSGQRPTQDWRIPIISWVIQILWKNQNITYIDIGSNLGNFNRAIGKLNHVTSSIGVEGTPAYNRLARLVSFATNCDNCRFIDSICGEDPWPITNISGPVCTLLSTYHHVKNPDQLLIDIKNMAPIGLILEMATQPECYNGKNWREKTHEIAQKTHLIHQFVLGYSGDYQRPLIILKNQPFSPNQLRKLTVIKFGILLINSYEKFTRIIKRLIRA